MRSHAYGGSLSSSSDDEFVAPIGARTHGNFGLSGNNDCGLDFSLLNNEVDKMIKEIDGEELFGFGTNSMMQKLEANRKYL